MYEKNSYIYIYICMCVCYCPTLREVFPNYDMVMFQPRKFTTLDLVSFTYCYIDYLLNTPDHLLLLSDVRPRGGGSPILTRLPSHWCPSYHLTGSSDHRGVTHTRPRIPKNLHPPPLTCHFQILTPPPPPPTLPRPRHNCRIPAVAAPKELYWKKWLD